MSDEPTYQESVRIGWTLLWRCVGGFLALLFAANLFLLFLMPELTRTEPSVWMSVLPVGVAAIISLFVIMPFIVRAVLTKSFHGFHIQFIRDRESPTRVQTIPGLSR
jgi:hypothetical protein